MRTILKCRECKEEMLIDQLTVGLTEEVVVVVSACGCQVGTGESDKSACEDCEDLALWKKRAEVAEAKLKNIHIFLHGSAQPARFESHHPHQPDNTKPEPTEPELDTNIKNLQSTKPEPAKFQTHATMPTEEDPDVNKLKPTSDIISTGGTIIPGIKKGSGDGVKAQY